MTSLHQTTTAPPTDIPGETRAPAREPTIPGDVGVPLLQAAITALLIAALLTALLANLTPHWPAILGLTFGTVLLLGWLWLLVDHRRLLWGVEKTTHHDLDGDQVIGPPPQDQTLVVDVREGNTRHLIRADVLQMSDDRLIKFALAVQRGRPMVETAWAKDTTIFPNGINSFKLVRQQLTEAGMLTRLSNASNATWTWTPAGRALIRRLVEHAHTHTHDPESPAPPHDRGGGHPRRHP